MTSKRQVIEILEMQIDGVPITEIAKKFNLTKGRISQLTNRPENQQLKQRMINRIADRIANANADEIIKSRKEKNDDVDSD